RGDELLAEATVEGDLVQGAFKRGELIIVQLRDEQIRDTAQMDGGGFGQATQARVGQRDDDLTGVARDSRASHRAFRTQARHQAVEDAGHIRFRTYLHVQTDRTSTELKKPPGRSASRKWPC